MKRFSQTINRPLLPGWRETVPATPASSAATPPSLSVSLHATASHDEAVLSPSDTDISLFIYRRKFSKIFGNKYHVLMIYGRQTD